MLMFLFVYISRSRANSNILTRRLCRNRSCDDNELYRSNSFKFERFRRDDMNDVVVNTLPKQVTDSVPSRFSLFRNSFECKQNDRFAVCVCQYDARSPNKLVFNPYSPVPDCIGTCASAQCSDDATLPMCNGHSRHGIGIRSGIALTLNYFRLHFRVDPRWAYLIWID